MIRYPVTDEPADEPRIACCYFPCHETILLRDWNKHDARHFGWIPGPPEWGSPMPQAQLDAIETLMQDVDGWEPEASADYLTSILHARETRERILRGLL